MKTIRIFLLVLIVLGIGLLCTQKTWVPKLVNRIILLDKSSFVVPAIQSDALLQNGRQCYTYDHEAVKNEPYAVREFIDININNKLVNGTKTGTQRGPDMTNGYNGTLTGDLENNTITVIFAYTIEGSANKEKEIYRATKTGIEKLRYPLIEKGRILVPDTTKEFEVLLYARVGCAASN